MVIYFGGFCGDGDQKKDTRRGKGCMSKTVIYTRQSLNAEKQKNSTGMQKEKCLELAEKKGFLVHDYYNEGERSARVTGINDRPELVRLLHAAEKGEISRLIVYKRDRLARNVEQYMEILSRLLKAKVEILFAAENEPPIIRGPIGEFVEIVLAGLAQQEGENIYLRQLEAKRYNAKNGRRSAGGASFGYEIIDTEIKLHDDEKIIVKNIYLLFNRFYRKDRGLDEILTLIDNHLPKKPEKGFSRPFFESIIPRTIHKGDLVQYVGGEPIPYKIKEIVDDKVWEEANKNLKELCPHLYEEIEKKEPYPALLIGKIICLACSDLNDPEKTFYFKKQKVNYTCENEACKRTLRMKEYDDDIAKKVLDKLKEIAAGQRVLLKHLIESRFLSQPRKEQEALKRKLFTIEMKVKETLARIIKGEGDKSELDSLTRSYQEKHKRLANKDIQIFHLEKAVQEMDVDKYVNELGIEHLNHEQKRHLLSSVQKIYDDESMLKITYANGVNPNERSHAS
jgi:site-specific DNA recombinase